MHGTIPEARLAEARRELDALWNRCELWELGPAVYELASLVAPATALRTLNALHLVTFLLVRRRIEGIELATADGRLRQAADST